MSEPFFPSIERIRYEGPESENPLAFRYYDADRVVLGKRMEDQLRFAVCYWHSFGFAGADVFGAGDLRAAVARRRRPDGARRTQDRGRLRVLHEARRALLQLPRSRRRARGARRCASRHAPRPAWPRGSRRRWSARASGCSGAPRTCSAIRATRPGAATNPDPEVFAYAAAQVQHALEVTHRLGGANYVLWGGREGYDTLLNTDLRRERRAARPLPRAWSPSTSTRSASRARC